MNGLQVDDKLSTSDLETRDHKEAVLRHCEIPGNLPLGILGNHLAQTTGKHPCRAEAWTGGLNSAEKRYIPAFKEYNSYLFFFCSGVFKCC